MIKTLFPTKPIPSPKKVERLLYFMHPPRSLAGVCPVHVGQGPQAEPGPVLAGVHVTVDGHLGAVERGLEGLANLGKFEIRC